MLRKEDLVLPEGSADRCRNPLVHYLRDDPDERRNLRTAALASTLCGSQEANLERLLRHNVIQKGWFTCEATQWPEPESSPRQ